MNEIDVVPGERDRIGEKTKRNPFPEPSVPVNGSLCSCPAHSDKVSYRVRDLM